MPDELTNDAIAQLLIDARARSYTLRPGGEKRVTLTLECVEMLRHEVLRLRANSDEAYQRMLHRARHALRPMCEEVLRLRSDLAAARAERDAAVAEAVQRERERCAEICKNAADGAALNYRDSYDYAQWIVNKTAIELAAAIRRGE